MSPFLLENEQIYLAWREKKLLLPSPDFENIRVKIGDLNRITSSEKAAILACCDKYNMVIYETDETHCEPETLKAFAANFGLVNLDQHYCHDSGGITALQVSAKNNKGGFIPYSDKAINWHTDGYYNSPDQQVYALLLHCDTPAIEGGENWIMDHELAYIRLRDENPAFIEALMHEQAMTIPPHVENGKEVRGAQSGPVFSTYNKGQKLHMRYSQRKRNIVWRDDGITGEAVTFLNHLLNDDKRDKLHIKLREGQGVLANNVLHTRSAFKDTSEQSRLLYRGRFFEPIH